MKKKGSLSYILIFAAIVLLFCVFVAQDHKKELKYGLDYDYDPLQLVGVKVISRGNAYQDYTAAEGERLYELIMTYENASNYAVTQTSWFDTYVENAMGDTGYAFLISPESNSLFVRDSEDTAAIPAGKTGSIRYMLQTEEDAVALYIEETDDKMLGDKKKVEIALPAGEGSSEWVELPVD